MVDRSDIDRITAASQEAVKSATNALEIFLETAEGWPPEEVRDGLLELIPDLVNEYGDVAASAAADWYEQVRSTEAAGPYRAVLAEPVPREQVEGTVRAAARHLFTGDVAVTQRILEGALHRYITNQARNTTVRNTLRDPQAKRFARVPRGKSCAWCALLGSRGFVYATAKSAGENNQYHDKCDCQIVPAFDDDPPEIEGYDPDALFQEYNEARNAVIKAGIPPTDKTIAKAMRDRGGSRYTDGLGLPRTSVTPRPKRAKPAVKDGKYLATPRGSKGQRTRLSFGPKDVKVADKAVAHLLYGDTGKHGRQTGGHLYTTVVAQMREGQISFPEAWGAEQVKSAIRTVVNAPDRVDARASDKVNLVATVGGVEVVVQVRVPKQGPTVITAHPMRGKGVMRVHNGKLTAVE
ncbi:MAG: hypothetical protein E7K79_04035 [Actinomyces urogenitalis]|nr:hypothetical protein [Actinomyces urogenitalis]